MTIKYHQAEKSETGSFAYTPAKGAKVITAPTTAVLETRERVLTSVIMDDDEFVKLLQAKFVENAVTILISADDSKLMYSNPVTGTQTKLTSNLAVILQAVVADYPEFEGYEHSAAFPALTRVLRKFHKTYLGTEFNTREGSAYFAKSGKKDLAGNDIQGVFINRYDANKCPTGIPDSHLVALPNDTGLLASVFIKAMRAEYKHLAKCSAVAGLTDVAKLEIEIAKQISSYFQLNHIRKAMQVIIHHAEGGSGKSVSALAVCNLSGYAINANISDLVGDSEQKSVGWEDAKIVLAEEITIPMELVPAYKNMMTTVQAICNRKYGSLTIEKVQYNVIGTSNNLGDFAIGAYNRRAVCYSHAPTNDDIYPHDQTPRVVLSWAEVDALLARNGEFTFIDASRPEIRENEDGNPVVTFGMLGDFLAKPEVCPMNAKAIAVRELSLDYDHSKDSKMCIARSSRQPTIDGLALESVSLGNPEITAIVDELAKNHSDANIINLDVVASAVNVPLYGDVRNYFGGGLYQVDGVIYSLVTFEGINYLAIDEFDDGENVDMVEAFHKAETRPALNLSPAMQSAHVCKLLAESFPQGSKSKIMGKPELEAFLMAHGISKVGIRANEELFKDAVLGRFTFTYKRADGSLLIKFK